MRWAIARGPVAMETIFAPHGIESARSTLPELAHPLLCWCKARFLLDLAQKGRTGVDERHAGGGLPKVGRGKTAPGTDGDPGDRGRGSHIHWAARHLTVAVTAKRGKQAGC